eukprot:9442860-Pyramimonas_sp.AAC.1
MWKPIRPELRHEAKATNPKHTSDNWANPAATGQAAPAPNAPLGHSGYPPNATLGQSGHWAGQAGPN